RRPRGGLLPSGPRAYDCRTIVGAATAGGESQRDAFVPAPAGAPSARRAHAGRGHVSRVRRAGPRRVPRPQRGRLVGRREVPGLPGLRPPRAGAAARLARPAGHHRLMLGVDVGGTFTDVVCVRDGRIAVTKVPSSRSDPAAPVVEGARRLGVEGATVFNRASTMGLNAVIERRLPKIGFLTTDGFRDVLDRGTIHRPLDAQTDPAWRRPFGDAARPIVPRYLRRGIVERMRADGTVFRPLDEDQARAELELLKRCDVEGVAICLINAYVDDAHERRLRELAREVLGDDVAISISSEVSPLAKEYARSSTTVIDVLMKIL